MGELAEEKVEEFLTYLDQAIDRLRSERQEYISRREYNLASICKQEQAVYQKVRREFARIMNGRGEASRGGGK